jgi:hypothetical protein
MDGPPRAFWQIWNMSFGFLGIQFGWGLPMVLHECNLRIPATQGPMSFQFSGWQRR